MQPSIIFFDEIDGLAPSRNGRNDQAHNSIVSTLLTVMDGVESRGQVIVIATTNRLDTIDPALRRPGRFDRELYFPKPNCEARKEIIKLHTEDWGISSNLISDIAIKTIGYSGADIKGLCSQTSIGAFHRCNPDIYSKKKKKTSKFISSTGQIGIDEEDFIEAMHRLKPQVSRAGCNTTKPTRGHIEVLLSQSKESIVSIIKRGLTLHRTRLLLCGHNDCGQVDIIKSSLHDLDDWTTVTIDLQTLSGKDFNTPAQTCCKLFSEAFQKRPSVVFIPDIDRIWEVSGEMLCETLRQRVHMDCSALGVVVIATANQEYKQLDLNIQSIFDDSYNEVISMKNPNVNQIVLYVGSTLKDLFAKCLFIDIIVRVT